MVSVGLAHAARSQDTPALAAAKEMLARRGSAERHYRNMVAFLAPDRTRLEELLQAVRQHLAWSRIDDEADELNLDGFQRKQAATKRAQADDAVRQRIAETYQWLLVPTQPRGGELVVKVNGQGSLAKRPSRRMVHDDTLVTTYAPTLLRLELDRVPLWRDGDHVRVRQVWEDYARHPYLPHLRDVDVLLEAVRRGPATTALEQEGFGYAEGFDEERRRYRGLRVHEEVPAVTLDGLLVKPEVALAQARVERDQQVTAVASVAEGDGGTSPERAGTGGEARSVPSRFYGRKSLDATRLGRDAGAIAQEIVWHLTALEGANVEITLEIQAEHPEGFDDDLRRVVGENARTLKFETFEFE